MLLGIDEAGRGPVLGPMVIAGVLVKTQNDLKQLDVKDSKLLTPEERTTIEPKIKAISSSFVVTITPEEIDKALKDPESNLNQLEADGMTKIIQQLKPTKVIIDLPGKNPDTFLKMIKADLSQIEVIAENKADMNYPVVAAASILAKVKRDQEMQSLSKNFNMNLGSGYPSDPQTKEILKANWNNPKFDKIIRKTWAPWKELKKQAGQSSLTSW